MSDDTVDNLDIAAPADLGDVAVDRNAEVPIGVQLAWALRSRVGDGRLTPGQRLPGLRELADSIGVNVNTVRAVYQRLEQDGLIASHQGSGTFVGSAPQAPSAVGTIAASAAREAQQTGVDPRDVAAALYVASETAGPAVPAKPEGAERRRLLRAQISELERTLSEIEASNPGVAPPPNAVGAGVGLGPSLLSAAELEHVRTALLRRLGAVQTSIDERAAVEAYEHDASASLPATSHRPAAKPQPQAQQKPQPKPQRAPKPRGGTRPAPAGT